jgi:hypothetical protein
VSEKTDIFRHPYVRSSGFGLLSFCCCSPDAVRKTSLRSRKCNSIHLPASQSSIAAALLIFRRESLWSF